MSYDQTEFDIEMDEFQDNQVEDNEDNKEVPEDSNNKSKKTKKVKEKTDKTEELEVSDKVLYFVSDKITPNLVDYARGCGLNLTNIYGSVDRMRDIRLMQFSSARIVIIDSGTGKFVTPTIRKDLIDLLGMNDEETQFTVFYTDSIIKSSTEEEIGKNSKYIEWFKYDNTVTCIANLLNHKYEHYVIDSSTNYKESEDNKQNILNMMGEPTPGVELEKISRLSINPANIKSNIELGDNRLPGYKINL